MQNLESQSHAAFMYAAINVLAAACVGIGWIDGITLVTFYWLETGVISLYGIAGGLSFFGVGEKHETPSVRAVAGTTGVWIFHGLFLHFLHVEGRDLDLNLTRNPPWILEWMDATTWLVLTLVVIGHGIWRFRDPRALKATPILPLARILKLQLAIMVGGFYWTEFHTRDAGLFALVGANLVDLVREQRESRKPNRAPDVPDTIHVRGRLKHGSSASKAMASSPRTAENRFGDEEDHSGSGRKPTCGNTPNLKD